MSVRDDYLSEALEMMLPSDALVSNRARLFMRRDHDVQGADGTWYKRNMIVGALLDDLILPDAREEQMLDGKIIILPRGIWTSKSLEDSPAAGLRSDQILVGNTCFHPENWARRLR